MLRGSWLSFALVLVACGASHSAPPQAASAPAAVSLPSRPSRPVDRVIVVSVDGLRAADSAELPTIGALAREGAFAAPPEGALSVMPSVTYPSHTSMVTGVNPRRHGITTNTAPDPSSDGKNKSGWRWYHDEVRVPTVYDLAYAAGLRTVLLAWPVTLGARATAVLPEFWVPQVTGEAKVLRMLSTPGFFDRVERRFPRFAQRYDPDHLLNEPIIDAAITSLEELDPDLMLVHVIEVDGTQHEHGPDSPEAVEARRRTDADVARLLAAVRASPRWQDTVFAVVSDHGFLAVEKLIAPNVQLKARGLKDRVFMIGSGGTGWFYLQSPEDTEAATLTRQLFEELARDPANGIATVLDKSAIEALGGDADAFLAIEARPTFSISRDRTGPFITDSAASYKGTHGYLPERPEMRATMLFYGPRVIPGVLHGARLIDLAPTLAGWLGLKLGPTDGTPLAVQLRPDRESRSAP